VYNYDKKNADYT